MNSLINVINGINGYAKVINNKIRVFLLLKDLIDKLDLYKYELKSIKSDIKPVKALISVIEIDNKSQDYLYPLQQYEKIIDIDSLNTLVNNAKQSLINTDPDVVLYLTPNPITQDSYIPVELVLFMTSQIQTIQARNFISMLNNQVIPAFYSTIQPTNKYFPSPTNLFQGNTTVLNNAYRIYYANMNTIRYVTDTDEYAIYSETVDPITHNPTGGGKWDIGKPKKLYPVITNLSNQLSKTAKTESDDAIVRSLQSGNMSGIIDCLGGIEECFISKNDIDRHPELLNVLNGVIDLNCILLIQVCI